MAFAITAADVQAAYARIAPYVLRTPVFTSTGIDAQASAAVGRAVRVHFKMETFQKTGAFKIRGAANAVLSLSDEDARRGVVTRPTPLCAGSSTSLRRCG